jgi:hypothetical protein
LCPNSLRGGVGDDRGTAILLTSRRVVVEEVNEGRLCEAMVSDPERESGLGGDNREASSYKGVLCCARLLVEVLPPNA